MKEMRKRTIGQEDVLLFGQCYIAVSELPSHSRAQCSKTRKKWSKLFYSLVRHSVFFYFGSLGQKINVKLHKNDPNTYSPFRSGGKNK